MKKNTLPIIIILAVLLGAGGLFISNQKDNKIEIQIYTKSHQLFKLHETDLYQNYDFFF